MKCRRLPALIVLLPLSTYAATTTVSTVSGLESALAVAVTNRQDDVINVATGIYSLTQTLYYIAPTNENRSLTLQCAGGGAYLDAGTISIGVMRGMYISTSGTAAHVTLDGLTIANGRLNGNEGTGAGLFARVLRGSLTVQDCAFINNTAKEFLGPLVDSAGAWVRVDNSPGVLTVRDCLFTNNYASGTAGGLNMTVTGSATGRLFNCFFVTNSAANQGGGAYINVVNGRVYVENNTFTANWTGNGVTGGGGLGVRVFLNTDSATIRNNVFWGNASNTGLGTDLYAEDDPDGDATGATIEFFNNDYGDFDVQDGDHITSGSNTTNNPLFSADLHLRAGSPCIDAGTNLAWMAAAVDLDGQSRLFNGRVDIGVDETVIGGTTVALTNGVATTWETVVDAKCQLQYLADAQSPTWLNAGGVVTATLGQVTIVDTSATNTMRAYRLQWLP